RKEGSAVDGRCVGQAEDDDQGEDRGLRRKVEVLFADRWQDGPLQADHRADEGVDDDEQRELPDVLTQSETHLSHRGATRAPWLIRRVCSIAAGFGGTLESASTNSSRELESSGFHCFSKARALDGVLLRPVPQTEPETCAGKISRSSGKVSSRVWMLSWSWPAFSRARPGRSGRPTAPTNSVSPVSTNQGSVPRRRSVTTRQMLSGVCPGVCRTSRRVLPSSVFWPSLSGS